MIFYQLHFPQTVAMIVAKRETDLGDNMGKWNWNMYLETLFDRLSTMVLKHYTFFRPVITGTSQMTTDEPVTSAPSASKYDQPTVVTVQPTPTNGTVHAHYQITSASDNSIRDPEKQHSDGGNVSNQMGNVVGDVAQVVLEDWEDDIDYVDEDERCNICDNLISSGNTYWKCRRLSCTNRITLCMRCYGNVDPPTSVLEHKAHMMQRNWSFESKT